MLPIGMTRESHKQRGEIDAGELLIREVMSTVPSLILLGFRRGHAPERACMRSGVSTDAGMSLVCPALASLPSRAPWLSMLITLTCLINTQGPSPERRLIAPVKRSLRRGCPLRA